MNFNIEELATSSFNLVISKRRAGKSYLIQDLVKKMAEKKMVDIAFLFSGTNAGFEEVCPPERRFTDLEPLHDILNNYKTFNQYNKQQTDEKKKIRFKACIIIDDLAVKLKSKEFNVLETIAVNGRHFSYEPLSLCFFVISQSLTKIPRVVRLQADTIIFNQIGSANELKLICDECLYLADSSLEGKKRARQFYHDIVNSQPYTFLVVENFRNNIRKMEDYLKSVRAS